MSSKISEYKAMFRQKCHDNFGIKSKYLMENSASKLDWLAYMQSLQCSKVTIGIKSHDCMP